jgi:hypothetical protein
LKLRVFVSWSGDRSRSVAEAMVEWLPRVLQAADPWMSRQIEKGDRWSQRIGEKLAENQVGLICVTPENSTAPWLLFEAGALSKALGTAKVCPVLLGVSPQELRGPLAQFQATLTEKSDLLSLLQTLNGKLDDEAVDTAVLAGAFNREWPRLERKLRKVAATPMQATALSVPSVIRTFAQHGFPEPDVGSAAHFTSGFESHGLYSTVCELAQKQLVVFGRKNRKLFDKEHSDFFAGIRAKLEEGFDFRCLFLDPDAPPHAIFAAHQDDGFAVELGACIDRACALLSASGLDPSRHFRLYRIQRSSSMLIVDDAVLYARIKMTPEGRACALTKCPFTVVNSRSPIGAELLEDFETAWSGARPLEMP